MPSRVFMICDAYESGIGHGLQRDGLKDGASYYADAELAEAYCAGYALGDERAKGDALKPPHAVQPVAAQPARGDDAKLIGVLNEINKFIDDGSSFGLPMHVESLVDKMVDVLRAALPPAQPERDDVFVEYFKASQAFQSTVGYPGASDERKAEKRYDDATRAVRAAIAASKSKGE